MSAIAEVLRAMGHTVTGSDLVATPAFKRLKAAGLPLVLGHTPDHLGAAEVVTSSSAIPDDNVELEAARANGLAVLTRGEMVAAIGATRKVIGVAGTHGKTTTACMLAMVLAEAGLRPSLLVGGELNETGSGARWDDGEWAVLEADESYGTFLDLQPDLAVVTSVETDHLDYYGTSTALIEAFRSFVRLARGARVGCADYPVAAQLVREAGGVTYGTAPDADYRIVDQHGDRRSFTFSLSHRGRLLGEVRLGVPGAWNARNAAAAAVVGLTLGTTMDDASRALARFSGVARRYQFRGERNGVTFVDDYAHLPGEVQPMVETALQGGWERVVCVFQPHRYTRTAALWRDFADAFVGADLVLVTDVYPANESPAPGVSGALIVEAVKARHPAMAIEYLESRPALRRRLAEVLASGDLCLTLGAGDLTTLPDELLSGPWGARVAEPGQGVDEPTADAQEPASDEGPGPS
jgi:UDP-N-acetylmuramate--alanine ligase